MSPGGALEIDASDVAGILQRLYDARVQFPLHSRESLVSALGGEAAPVADDGRGTGVTAGQVGDHVFSVARAFAHPDDVVDAVLSVPYVTSIAKTLAIDKVRAARYPLGSPGDLLKGLNALPLLGVDLAELSEHLEFPVDSPEEVIRGLEALEPGTFGDDVPLMEGFDTIGEFGGGEGKEALPGYTYLVMEEKPSFCYMSFMEIIEAGLPGLCITRTNPKNLRNEFGLEGADVFWLTDRDSNTEETLGSSLENLMFNLEGFLTENPRGVICLDGLEFLVSTHGFDPVQRFTRQLKDLVSMGEHILMFPVSPYVLEKKQLKSLEREMEPVHEGEILMVGDVLTELGKTVAAQRKEKGPSPGKPEPAPAGDTGDFTVSEEELDAALDLDGLDGETGPEPERAAVGEDVGKAAEGSGEVAAAGAGDGLGELDATSGVKSETGVAEAETAGEAGAGEGKEGCTSCEGKGTCYWCAGSSKCHTCEGEGSIAGKQCRSCKGTGTCASCNGTGSCYWCDGKGFTE